MEMNDRKTNPLNKTYALTLFVKKQKEVENSQAFLSLRSEGILKLDKTIIQFLSYSFQGKIRFSFKVNTSLKWYKNTL